MTISDLELHVLAWPSSSFETDQKVRFDPAKEGANGFEGKDHYHIYNPNSTGKSDYYLDSNGRPVRKGSKPSHVLPGR